MHQLNPSNSGLLLVPVPYLDLWGCIDRSIPPRAPLGILLLSQTRKDDGFSPQLRNSESCRTTQGGDNFEYSFGHKFVFDDAAGIFCRG
jgi:hypothetical protein